jgi:hypothetical protein
LSKNVNTMEEINQRLLFDSNYFDREFNIGSLSTLSLNEVRLSHSNERYRRSKGWLNSNDVKVYKRSKFIMSIRLM